MPFITWGNFIVLQTLGKGLLPNYGQSTRLKNKLTIPNLGFQSLYAKKHLLKLQNVIQKKSFELSETGI